MKKTIALILATVMLLALAVPAATAVETEAQTTTYPSYADADNGDLLWTVDFTDKAKFDCDVDRTADFATLTTNGGSATLVANMLDKTDTNLTYGGAFSDMPLNSDSVYTIDFNVDINSSYIWNYVFVDPAYKHGFAYRCDVASYSTDLRRSLDSRDYATIGITKKALTSEIGGQKRSFRLVLDAPNGILKFYMLDNKDVWSLVSVKEDYAPASETNLNLYFGYMGQASRGTGENKTNTVIVSDVKVYKGLTFDYVTVDKEGKLLLELGDMSQAQTGNHGVTYTPAFSYDSKGHTLTYSYTDEVHEIVCNTAGDWGQLTYGGKTNLRLDAGQKYTITYLSKYDHFATGISFSALGSARSVSVYMDKKGGALRLALIRGNDSANPLTEFVAVDSSVFSNDGYAEFAVEIDGYQVTVYINGTEMLTHSVLDANDNASKTSSKGYTSDLLTLALNDVVPVLDRSSSYKDIKLYSGNTITNTYVEVIDGETTETMILDKTVTEYELPKETKEGYMFMGWKVNGGEKLVKSGEKVDVATLESLEKVFVPVMSDIWCQVAKVYDTDGVTDTGKRNVRFVSGIDSLDYEAIGYDVTVTYGGQSYTKNDFELKHVYSSLVANTSYGTEKITLESLEYNSNDGYIVAFVIKNVPTTVGEINVDLTPYQIIDGEKVQGNTIPLVLTAADLNK